jgi:hypothetical protein
MEAGGSEGVVAVAGSDGVVAAAVVDDDDDDDAVAADDAPTGPDEDEDMIFIGLSESPTNRCPLSGVLVGVELLLIMCLLDFKLWRNADRMLEFRLRRITIKYSFGILITQNNANRRITTNSAFAPPTPCTLPDSIVVSSLS